jgi:hypothetical protein
VQQHARCESKDCVRYSIQINQPTRCNCFSRVYYSTFICGSTCFGRHPAHHQEHTTALGASGSTFGRKRLERCWSWSGQTTTNNAPDSCVLLIMEGETPETCSVTCKRRVASNSCIWLVALFESYDDAWTCERQKSQVYLIKYMIVSS